MPAAAIENQVLDLIVQKLDAIGAVPANWRTAPEPDVAAGTPLDALPEGDAPIVRAQWISTRHNQAEDAAGTTVSAHGLRMTFAIWCIASDPVAATNLMADVRDAIHASEGEFGSTFQQPLWADTARYRDDLSIAGKHVVELPAFMDFESIHAA